MIDKAKAQAMRDQGMSLRQIGDRLGVTGERVRQLTRPSQPQPIAADCAWCGKPLPLSRDRRQRYCDRRCGAAAGNQRAREKKASPCPHCGQNCVGKVCVRCKREQWAQERAVRFDRLAALWSEGLSAEQIAVEFDTTTNALGGLICRARAAGWDLPLRRARTPKRGALSKREARSQFQAALHQGVIRRPTRCEGCGEVGPVDGHHHDYQRPLYVEWLCPDCHHQTHHPQKAAA